MKFLRENFSAICGIGGGGILFLLLTAALLEHPRAINLWFALLVSVLMIAAGFVFGRPERREKGPGRDLGRGSMT